MTPEQAKQLLDKYHDGPLSEQEEQELEHCLKMGLIQLEELEDLQQISHQLEELIQLELSQSMKADFQELMAYESKRPRMSWLEGLQRFFGQFMPGSPLGNLALASVMLVVGLFLGKIWWDTPATNPNDEIAVLSRQMEEMKEMMMLTLLEKESPSDRLKAVNMTQEMPGASQRVTDALFTTLNTDDNVNVRLEVLDALYHYAKHPDVREGLIRSIAQQDSPLMQVALAEVMVALQEKKSVPALKELLDKDQVPDLIKEKLKEKINVLL
jgi:hypothetical protein